MIWHDLRDPNDPEFNALAERYHLHPRLVVVKPVHVNATGEMEVTDLDVFLGSDYLITVQKGD